MGNILQLRANAEKYGICHKYLRPFDVALSNGDKQALVDIATDINGAEFLCDGYAFGWGLDKEYLTREFADYTNKVILQNGYTSELLVDNSAPVATRTSLMILLGCKCTIKLPDDYICTIYTADSDIRIHGKGIVNLVEYGTSTALINEAVTVRKRETVTTSKWIK